MDKINKMMMDNFKNIFEIILKEAEEKVKSSGVDPSSKRGKALTSVIYKKVLVKLGIDLEKYTTEEFNMFWDKNKAELISDLRSQLDDTFSKGEKKYQTLEEKINQIGSHSVDWNDIKGVPNDLFKKDSGMDKKARGDISLLFKNILSIRESLTNYINIKVSELKKEIKRISDSQHQENHTLESHTDSELMKKIIDLIKNPPQPKIIRGGGDTVIAGPGIIITEDSMGIKTVSSTRVAGIWNEEYPASGAVDGANKIFTFTHKVAFISVEGQALSILNGDYAVDVTGYIAILANAPIENPLVNKYLS